MVKLENSRETNTGGIFKLGERPRPVERSILNELDERSRVFEKVSRYFSFSFFFFPPFLARERKIDREFNPKNDLHKKIDSHGTI